MINHFSAVSFVGLKFNVYFCHIVFSYGYMKRIINCKSYTVSNPIRIYMKAIQDAGVNLDKLTHLSVVLDGRVSSSLFLKTSWKHPC